MLPRSNATAVILQSQAECAVGLYHYMLQNTTVVYNIFYIIIQYCVLYVKYNRIKSRTAD